MLRGINHQTSSERCMDQKWNRLEKEISVKCVTDNKDRDPMIDSLPMTVEGVSLYTFPIWHAVGWDITGLFTLLPLTMTIVGRGVSF